MRAVAVSVLLAAVLAGCGVAPSAPADPGDDPGEVATSAPATGPGDPEPDEPVEDRPSVSLPQLPVGGSSEEFVDEGQDLQCAPVSWIVEESPGALREGIRITLTVARVNERFFTVADSGCEDVAESCAGYVFTADSDSPACAVPVRTRRPVTEEVTDTSLTLAGTVECVALETWECEEFVAAARSRSASVSLLAPAPEQPPASPTAEPSPTSG